MRPSLVLLPLAMLAAWPGAADAAEPTAIAIEYFHPGLGHYFFTSGADEIRTVDSGRDGLWVRTGGQFGTFAGPNDAPGLAPVCRFYGTPGIGPNSHFYTAHADAHENVKSHPG